MSGAIRRFAGGVLCVLALAMVVSAQAPKRAGVREKLVGTWHLQRIEPSSGPVPEGQLIYTRDGHMSVQLMYPESEKSLTNEYVQEGYEASFGTYDVDERAHTVTHHVKGSITRGRIVGKALSRRFEFTPDGHLLIRSVDPAEHWVVTWERS